LLGVSGTWRAAGPWLCSDLITCGMDIRGSEDGT
jgi:hypothetical protein